MKILLLAILLSGISISQGFAATSGSTSNLVVAGEIKLTDTTGAIARIDSSTRTLGQIDFTHHEIHKGDHFYYFDPIELNSSASQEYIVYTPNTTKWAHMFFDFDGSAITQFDIYEGTDRTGTTVQTIINNNRNSGTSPTVLIYKGASGGVTGGNKIFSYKGGSASQQSRSASTSRQESEIILKQNTRYSVVATSGTNNDLINMKFKFYEHTNN